MYVQRSTVLHSDADAQCDFIVHNVIFVLALPMVYSCGGLVGLIDRPLN